MSIASSNPIKRKTLFCLNDTRATYVYFKSFWDFHLNRDSKLQTLCSCRHGVVRFMTSFRWESYYFSIEWGGKKLNISTYSIYINFWNFLQLLLLLQHATGLPGAMSAYISPQHKTGLVLILWISPALSTFFLSLEGKVTTDAGAPAK